MVEHEPDTGQQEKEPKARRLVVTGLGAVTPLGNNVEDSWKNALSGMSPFHLSEKFGPEYPSRVLAEVDIDFSKYLSPKDLRRYHRSALFARLVAVQALSEAGLMDAETGRLIETDIVKPEMVGSWIGTAFGGAGEIAQAERIIAEKGPTGLSPTTVLVIEPERVNVAAAKLGLKGWHGGLYAACATGATNIAGAGIVIRAGELDIAVCGGSEAAIYPSTIAGFGQTRALSRKFTDNPRVASRPFDSDRDGFVPSEGAAVLVIEALGVTQSRGAKIYCELIGMVSSCDAGDDTRPDSENVAFTMRRALHQAGVSLGDVDVVIGHFTSTEQGDLEEVEALRKVFGESLSKISITAPKSMFGHMIGGAGSLNAVLASKAIQEGVVPPTINIENIDAAFKDVEECIVKDKPLERKVDVVLCNSFGFGGLNTVLVFKRFVP